MRAKFSEDLLEDRYLSLTTQIQIPTVILCIFDLIFRGSFLTDFLKAAGMFILRL